MKILLKQGILVTSQEILIGDLLLEDSKIGHISSYLATSADLVVDCEGKLILPGMIDTHVHFRDPGLTHKGDCYTESKAALAGGVTTVCDMPNTIPQTTTYELVKAKQELYAHKCLCDFGIYIGATKANLADLQLADEDSTIPAIKIFMAESTGEMTLFEDEYLRPIFAETRKLIAVHAEDERRRLQRLELFKQKKLPENTWVESKNPYQHAVIRDNLVAAEGTRKAVELALEFNHRTHILHISAKEELPHLERGVQSGLVSGETCPQYLFFDREQIKDYAGLRIMNPALKGRDDQQALWNAINQGLINHYATDHAPHLLEEKLRPYGQLPAGLPSIQFALPLLLHSVYQKRLTLNQVVQLYATNPAKNYKIRNKGDLVPGFDGDVVIVDPTQKIFIRSDMVLSKCGWSPYENMTLQGGSVIKTFRRGELVYDQGRFIETTKGKTITIEKS